MRSSSTPTTPISSVEGELNYFTPPADGSKAYYYINVDPITKIRKQNWVFSKVTKNIENARGKERK
jgi:hypothetical protein